MFDSCSIRPLAYDDLFNVLAWRNHIEVRRFMLTQHEINYEEHCSWYSNVSQDLTRRLLIVEEDKKPIGFVQLSNVCLGGVADWGFYARPDAPKGTGKKLGFTAIKYAFEELGLHKLCGQALEINLPSIALHQKLGFAQEGVLREHKKIEGVYHTMICFGLLAEEWRIRPSS